MSEDETQTGAEEAPKPATEDAAEHREAQRKSHKPHRPRHASFSGRTTNPGDIVVAKIVKVSGAVAFVDYGARSEGYIQLSELRGDDGELVANEGDEIEAQIVETRGAVRLSYRQARAGKVLETLEAAWKAERPVDGKVAAVNKGGFEIRVEGVRAFCPTSQMSERPPREPARMVGQTYQFLITEFGGGKSLVVSRRKLLEEQKARAKDNLETLYRPGDRVQGRVTQIREFGAFVELADGIEGMIHVSEISHDRIRTPADRLNVGDAVEVEVLKVEPDRGRVALSMKSLAKDPVADFLDGLQVGAQLEGTVVRLQDFGAFVSLAPGVDGLLHISAISPDRRLNHPSEVLREGEKVAVVVEKIDRRTRKIGLMTPEAAEARKPVDVPVKVGDVVKGRVTKVERFGVFIEIAERVNGLIPNAEMATDRGADHMRMFPVGTELEAKVIEIDKSRGQPRIRLSRKKLLSHDEDEAVKAYKKQQKEESHSLGTFGDLLKDFLQK